MTELSQQRLRSLLRYSEADQCFYWLKPRGGVRVGQRAGCKAHGYRVIRVDGASYHTSELLVLLNTGSLPTTPHVRKMYSNSTTGHRGVTTIKSGKGIRYVSQKLQRIRKSGLTSDQDQ